MGYAVGVALLVLTSMVTAWVTWQSPELDKELYSQAAIKRFSMHRDLLLLAWIANVAYWATAALNDWVK